MVLRGGACRDSRRLLKLMGVQPWSQYRISWVTYGT